MEPLKPADDEVAPVVGDVEVGMDGEGAGFPDLDLELKIKRCGQDVEPRAKVGRGSGHTNQATAAQGHVEVAILTPGPPARRPRAPDRRGVPPGPGQARSADPSARGR